MTLNIDRDVRHADWLRVIARMRVLRGMSPDARCRGARDRGARAGGRRLFYRASELGCRRRVKPLVVADQGNPGRPPLWLLHRAV
jgi:hypothetical protein